MNFRFLANPERILRCAVLLCLVVALWGLPAKNPANAESAAFYVNGYTYQEFPGTPFPYLSDGTVISLGDGELSAPISLGGDDPNKFNFTFYKNSYDTVYLCSNGAIQFQNNGPCGPSASPFPPSEPAVNPDPMIAAWWGDLNPVIPGSTIQYKTTGSAPNRVFSVEFKNVSHYNFGDPSTPIDQTTFQIVLYETTNIIEVYYAAAPASTLNLAGSAPIYHTAGIEQSPSVGLQYYYGQSALDTPRMVKYQVDAFVPAAPQIISPGNNDTVIGPDITFKWQGSTGAKGYRIIMDEGTSNEVIFDVDNATQKAIPLYAVGIHTWKVAAYSSSGYMSGFSGPVTFQVKLATYLPIIKR